MYEDGRETMSMVMDDPASIPPRYLVETYRQAYLRVHKREPSLCRYMGNSWYSINGETVHRADLLNEIYRLRDLGQKSTLINADKSVIQRLISRLRGK